MGEPPIADSGWLVAMLTTDQDGGGQPLKRYYMAGYNRAGEAEDAVRIASESLDNRASALRELDPSEIRAFKLKELEVRLHSDNRAET